MSPQKTLSCWSCKQQVEVPGKITRTDVCPNCDQPLKCCYNCRFYDRDAYHQCTEPQAEWVRYKEKANFCEYFSIRVPVEARPQSQQQPQQSQAPEAQQASRARARNAARNPRATPENPSSANGKDRQKAAWDSLFKD